MNEAGRPRKPAAVKARQGTLEASRTSAAEPEWRQFDAAPPESLDDDVAREAWARLVPEIVAQGLAPRVARDEMVALCNAWGTYIRAGRELASGGWVTVAESGYESPRAWVAIRKNSLSEYVTLCGRFGLDPASAGKVSARPPQAGEDELAKARAARRAAR